MPKRRTITPKMRFEVLKRDRFSCVYCGALASEETQLVVDHIDPFAAGGADDITNYTTACQKCNAGKGTSDVLVDRPRWWATCDRIVEALEELYDDVPGLLVSIAVEVSVLTDYGPGEDIPYEHLIDIVTAERLRKFVWGLGIEDPAEAFNWEAFRVACWMEIVSKRKDLGLRDWRPGR